MTCVKEKLNMTMCPGNRSTSNLDVYEKNSHLLKSSKSKDENSPDWNIVEEMKGEFKVYVLYLRF